MEERLFIGGSADGLRLRVRKDCRPFEEFHVPIRRSFTTKIETETYLSMEFTCSNQEIITVMAKKGLSSYEVMVLLISKYPKA